MQEACQGTIPLQRPAGWQTEGEEGFSLWRQRKTILFAEEFRT